MKVWFLATESTEEHGKSKKIKALLATKTTKGHEITDEDPLVLNPLSLFVFFRGFSG